MFFPVLGSWERVLRNCAVELQRSLPKVVRSKNLNLDDFSDIVASICQNSPEDEHESQIIMGDGFGPERTNGILKGANSLKTVVHCHQVKQLENTEAGKHSQPENAVVKGTMQAKAATIPKRRGRKPGSLQKPQVGYRNSMTGERRESYEGPGSQHANTDGSEPTKLRRKKYSAVVNRCNEVAAKTDTRTNHSPANVVIKKECDDSEEYFEKDSRMPHGINEKLVGRRVKVWWPLDQMFYEGAVASFDSLTQMHKVLYADGDEETLNLRNERWELLEEQHAPAASHKSLKKKKARTKEASSAKPATVSSAKGRRIADKSKTEAPKSGSSVDDFAPDSVCIADATKDDVSKVDPTYKQKSTSEADVSRPEVLRIADVAINSITVNPNPADDKHKLISEKETKTLMTIAKPKPCTVIKLGGESATHTTLIVKGKSPCERSSEDMEMGILADTINAQGSDPSSAKKRQRLVNGEGVAP